MLEIKNLTVFFENAALNDLSLEINQGEIVAVLGANSAGKTTLMNSISGLIVDMKKRELRKGGERINIIGEIKFEKEDIVSVEPVERVKKGITLTRERHTIFADSSVEENLKISSYLRKDREVKKSFEFIYSIFPPLKNITKRKAGFCSGGEQQMLAIGMALMTRPKLLLMDEPLLGLSPALQGNVFRAMKPIQKEGITILVSEQYARTLLPIVDRGYVISSGMLTYQGTSQELMENPEVRSAFMGL
jgi:branched-chain amino acid transport system ATP-binding protein